FSSPLRSSVTWHGVGLPRLLLLRRHQCNAVIPGRSLRLVPSRLNKSRNKVLPSRRLLAPPCLNGAWHLKERFSCSSERLFRLIQELLGLRRERRLHWLGKALRPARLQMDSINSRSSRPS